MEAGVLDKNEKSLNCILLGHTAGIFSPHMFGATRVLKFMGTIFPKFARISALGSKKRSNKKVVKESTRLRLKVLSAHKCIN